jgi:GTP-sensing pleiotropic transcriptional regulator CodY
MMRLSEIMRNIEDGEESLVRRQLEALTYSELQALKHMLENVDEMLYWAWVDRR